MLLQITAPHFCAGCWLLGDAVVGAAPILIYMIGWNEAKVRQYASKKRWTVTEIK